ncbi:hypothetical protein JXM83_05200 [Candidatus Woesearchaeota archaeon]|nr:hypothetical protein [Candidatus Woesearchaeota archaeon]
MNNIETLADVEYRKAIFGTKNKIVDSKLVVPFFNGVENADVVCYANDLKTFATFSTGVLYDTVVNQGDVFSVSILPRKTTNTPTDFLAEISLPTFELRPYFWENAKNQKKVSGIVVQQNEAYLPQLLTKYKKSIEN